MSQWLKAAKNSHAAITDISADPLNSTTVGQVQTVNSHDKPQTLIEKMSAQFPSLTERTESNEVGKSGKSNPKGTRRRGRRKSS